MFHFRSHFVATIIGYKWFVIHAKVFLILNICDVQYIVICIADVDDITYRYANLYGCGCNCTLVFSSSDLLYLSTNQFLQTHSYDYYNQINNSNN